MARETVCVSNTLSSPKEEELDMASGAALKADGRLSPLRIEPSFFRRGKRTRHGPGAASKADGRRKALGIETSSFRRGE